MYGRTNLKYNVLAGVFLVGGLALAVTLSFVFSKRAPLGWDRRFGVLFTLSDGAYGLKPGSQVTLGGQQIGRVTDINFEWSDGGAKVPSGVRVDVQCRSDITIYDNALIYLERPLLGTISAINIAAAGTNTEIRSGNTAIIEPGDLIPGVVAPPAFLSQAGWGPAQSQQFQRIVEDASVVMSETRAIVEENKGPVRESLRAAIDVINRFVENFERWSTQATDFLAKANKAADEFEPIATSVRAGVEEARGVIRSAQATVDAARDAVERNSRTLDSIMASVDRLASGLAGDVLGAVTEATREAPEIARSIRRASDDAAATVNSLRAELPNVRRSIASLRQAADSSKLAMDEIRAQPWRLLVRPNTKELREQLIFDAARAYAAAAGDLRTLGDTLEATTAEGVRTPDEREEVRRVVAELREAITQAKARERELERQLVDLLIELDGGTPAPRPPANAAANP